MTARRWRLAVRLNVVAVVWSAGLVLAGLLVPAYTSNSTSDLNGVTLTRSTLAQESGVRAMALVAVPLLACVVVLWAGVGLVAIETLLGLLTIGVFILPATILLAFAVRLAPGPMSGDDAAGDVSAAPATGT